MAKKTDKSRGKRLDPKSLTISTKNLMGLTVQDRFQMAQSSYGQEILQSLTPSQRAQLFPDYYRKQLGPSLFGATTGASPITSDYTGGGYTPPGVVETPPQTASEIKPSWYNRVLDAAGTPETTTRGSDFVPDTDPKSMKRDLTQVSGNEMTTEIYKAFRGIGYTDFGAKVMLAEIRREHGGEFASGGASAGRRPFGFEQEPAKRDQVNFGFINSTGARTKELLNYLDGKGLVSYDAPKSRLNPSGIRVHPTPETLQAMAQWYDTDLRTKGARDPHAIIKGADPKQLPDLLRDPNYKDNEDAHRRTAAWIQWQHPEIYGGKYKYGIAGQRHYNMMLADQARLDGIITQQGQKGAKDLLAMPTTDPSQTGTMAPAGGLRTKTKTDIPQNEPQSRITGSPGGTHPVLREIMTEASKNLPEGYTVKLISSARTTSDVGSHSFHLKRDENNNALAVDVQIYDPNGKPLENIRSPQNFGIYRDFMQNAKKILVDRHPEYAGMGRWGGYFVQGDAQDLMHFDLGPEMQTQAGNWLTGLKKEYAHFGTQADVGKGMGSFENYTMQGGVASATLINPPPPGFAQLPAPIQDYISTLPAEKQNTFFKAIEKIGPDKVTEFYNQSDESKLAQQKQAKGIVDAVTQAPPKAFTSSQEQQQYYDELYSNASRISGVSYAGSQGLCGKGARGLVGALLNDQYFNRGLGDSSGESPVPKSHAGSLSSGNRYLQDSGYYNDGTPVQPDQILSPEYLKSLPIGTVISAQGKGPGHVQTKVGANEWASDFKQGNKVLGGYNNYVVHTPNQAGLQKLDPRIANDADTIAYAQSKGYALSPDQNQEVQASKIATAPGPQPGQTGSLAVGGEGTMQPKDNAQPPPTETQNQAMTTSPPAVPSATPPEQVKVSAYGGQVRPAGDNIGIQPVGNVAPIGGNFKGDNRMIVDSKGAVSTFNDRTERVTQDARSGAIDIRPVTRTNPRDIEQRMDTKQQSMNNMADQRMADSTVNVTSQRTPTSENVLNPNHQANMNALAQEMNPFGSASNKRAMYRATRFQEIGHAADFSLHQSNYRT